jgi:hypothetical protein
VRGRHLLRLVAAVVLRMARGRSHRCLARELDGTAERWNAALPGLLRQARDALRAAALTELPARGENLVRDSRRAHVRRATDDTGPPRRSQLPRRPVQQPGTDLGPSASKTPAGQGGHAAFPDFCRSGGLRVCRRPPIRLAL